MIPWIFLLLLLPGHVTNLKLAFRIAALIRNPCLLGRCFSYALLWGGLEWKLPALCYLKTWRGKITRGWGQWGVRTGGAGPGQLDLGQPQAVCLLYPTSLWALLFSGSHVWMWKASYGELEAVTRFSLRTPVVLNITHCMTPPYKNFAWTVYRERLYGKWDIIWEGRSDQSLLL